MVKLSNYIQVEVTLRQVERICLEEPIDVDRPEEEVMKDIREAIFNGGIEDITEEYFDEYLTVDDYESLNEVDEDGEDVDT